jgi:hypothetical protein
MLYMVEKEKALTEVELRARASQAFDFSDNPALRGFGLNPQSDPSKLVEQSLQELYKSGWLAGNERLSITDAGRKHLSRVVKGTRGERHRLSTGGE